MKLSPAKKNIKYISIYLCIIFPKQTIKRNSNLKVMFPECPFSDHPFHVFFSFDVNRIDSMFRKKNRLIFILCKNYEGIKK